MEIFQPAIPDGVFVYPYTWSLVDIPKPV
jgi:hypothetical protein